MNCAKHPKVKLVEVTVATKTEQIGKHTVIRESKTGLCCEKCGVVAWGSLPRTPVYLGVGGTSATGPVQAWNFAA